MLQLGIALSKLIPIFSKDKLMASAEVWVATSLDGTFSTPEILKQPSGMAHLRWLGARCAVLCCIKAPDPVGHIATPATHKKKQDPSVNFTL